MAEEYNIGVHLMLSFVSEKFRADSSIELITRAWSDMVFWHNFDPTFSYPSSCSEEIKLNQITDQNQK